MKPMFSLTLLVLSLYSYSVAAQQEELHGFVADRPGATDSPTTMLPGQYRIESGLITLSQDEVSDTKTTESRFISINLVSGLTENSEVQLSYDPVVEQTMEVYGKSESQSSTGDITLKYKHNILGNGNGPVGLAVIPQLTYTSKENGEDLLGGIGVPVSIELPMELELSMTPQWNLEKTSDDTPFSSQYLGMVLGKNFGESFNGFIEYFHTSSSMGGFEALAGLGFAHQIGESFQWDASVDFGLTEESTDSILSAGIIYAWN